MKRLTLITLTIMSLVAAFVFATKTKNYLKFDVFVDTASADSTNTQGTTQGGEGGSQGQGEGGSGGGQGGGGCSST